MVMCVASFFIILSEKVTDRKRLLSCFFREDLVGMVGIENCKCASELLKNLRKEKDFAHSLNNFYSKS